MSDAIPFSEFVSIPVPGDGNSKISIKKFVESKGITFKVGNGFYQLSKPEIIQLNKTIMVQRLTAPDTLITGSATIRNVLKIDESVKRNGRFMVDDEILKEFRIFVQSTSYNRNLIGGTTFLYRKNDGDAPVAAGTSATTTSSADGEDGPAAPKRSRVTPKRGTRAPSSPPLSPPATATAQTGTSGNTHDNLDL